MCKLDKDFILCTCGGEELPFDDIAWYLYRIDTSLPLLYRKGRASMPEYTKKEDAIRVDVAASLNSSNRFDFDFEPKEGDFLRLRIKEKKDVWAQFRFLKGQWETDESNSLTGWRSQLVKLENGKVK